MYVNFLIVFFLSGLWHGAGFHFIVWGMLHGALYVATRFWQKRIRPAIVGNGENAEGRRETEAGQRKAAAGKQGGRIMTIVSQIATFFFVSVAWVYFRAADLGQANSMLLTALRGKMQGISPELAECFRVDEFWYVLKVLRLDSLPVSRYILMFAILLTGLYFAMIGKNAQQRTARLKYRTGAAAVITVLMVWCVLSFSGVSTFLYFNF